MSKNNYSHIILKTARMKIYQYSLYESSSYVDFNIPFTPDILFLFVSPTFSEKKEFLSALQSKYPDAIMVGGSSYDNTGVDNPYLKKVEFTAVKLESGSFKAEYVSMDEVYTSYEAGDILAEKLNDSDLKHIFIFSDGYNVRGSDLINGLRYSLLNNVSITGNIPISEANRDGFVIINGALFNDCILGLAIYDKQIENITGHIDRYEKIGPDVLTKKTLERILFEMEEQPQATYS